MPLWIFRLPAPRPKVKPMENVDGQLIDPDLWVDPINARMLRVLWQHAAGKCASMWIAE